jgi:hypothetical protein
MAEVHPFIANLLEHLDFGCDFDDKGVCARNRAHPDIYPTGQYEDRGCCSFCPTTKGYLEEEADFGEVKHLFDKNTGFWRKGVGCILPRENRSKPCSFYYCKEHINPLEELTIWAFEDANFILTGEHAKLIRMRKTSYEYKYRSTWR